MTEEKSRMKQPEANLVIRRGLKFKIFGEKKVAVATTGDYLGNLDLWVVIL